MENSPRKRRIFILDDNDIDRETCRRHLSRSTSHEYHTMEFNGIEGALEIVEKEKPDCILLDYHLHDGNGIEFIHQLAKLGGPRNNPVVMLTGTGNESIAVEVMKAGIQDYIIKEKLNPEILERAVEGAIYKAHTERLLDAQRIEMERLFKEAQEANARKDHFLATLSHELRTPLTPVLVAVSALDSGEMSQEENQQMLNIIRRNIELEARLIDDLLDLTRISSGKLEIDTRPADLHSILHHAADTCREDISQKSLHLSWILKARLSTVEADPARLQQVFWNVLKNAVKFTPENGRIEIFSTNPTPTTIEIEIADTGIGIQPENIGKIFKAFEQGNVEITRRFGGLGLGLAISKALIEAHGGTIRAESDPDNRQGARFFICLHTQNTVSEVASSGTPQKFNRDAVNTLATILLVEDHADSALLLATILRKEGYRVHVASNIAKALAIFNSETIDCVVSDIGLPDGSGTELMQALMEIRPIPGIALSGYGMEKDIQNSQEAGFSLHLTKPIHWQKLKVAVENVLRAAP